MGSIDEMDCNTFTMMNFGWEQTLGKCQVAMEKSWFYSKRSIPKTFDPGIYGPVSPESLRNTPHPRLAPI
jgi:hypothetical protein